MEAIRNTWEKDGTWIRHVEPWRVGHGVQVDVSPGREAVAVGLRGQDVEDGQQEADQPGTAHPEQSLRVEGRSLGGGPDLILLSH